MSFNSMTIENTTSKNSPLNICEILCIFGVMLSSLGGPINLLGFG
jgi:hypothetical protein